MNSFSISFSLASNLTYSYSVYLSACFFSSFDVSVKFSCSSSLQGVTVSSYNTWVSMSTIISKFYFFIYYIGEKSSLLCELYRIIQLRLLWQGMVTLFISGRFSNHFYSTATQKSKIGFQYYLKIISGWVNSFDIICTTKSWRIRPTSRFT